MSNRSGDQTPKLTGEWHILRARPRRELTAKTRLESMGAEVIVPVERKTKKAHWRCRRKVETGPEYPLFPGYVFAKKDSFSWVEALKDSAISGAVVSDGQYAKVQASELAPFNVAKQAPLNRHRAFIVDAQVRIKAGNFAGHIAPIEAVQQGSVVLTVRLMGRPIKLRVPLDDLESAC